mmetsp:Transcript_31906/g.42132  ORF Transcript_31906/g.42132 Transcript_31906/m.42132 type:complete len:450 (-) Transcript_31906:365-1714(-)
MVASLKNILEAFQTCVDLVSDGLSVIEFFQNGNLYWASLGSGFIALATLSSVFLGAVFCTNFKSKRWLLWASLAVAFGLVHQSAAVLASYALSFASHQQIQAADLNESSAIIRVFEGVFRVLPMAILQTHATFVKWDLNFNYGSGGNTAVVIISASLSCVTLAYIYANNWMTALSKSSLISEKHRLPAIGFFLQTLCGVVSKILTIGILSLCIRSYTYVLVLPLWIVKTVVARCLDVKPGQRTKLTWQKSAGQGVVRIMFDFFKVVTGPAAIISTVLKGLEIAIALGIEGLGFGQHRLHDGTYYLVGGIACIAYLIEVIVVLAFALKYEYTSQQGVTARGLEAVWITRVQDFHQNKAKSETPQQHLSPKDTITSDAKVNTALEIPSADIEEQAENQKSLQPMIQVSDDSSRGVEDATCWTPSKFICGLLCQVSEEQQTDPKNREISYNL